MTAPAGDSAPADDVQPADTSPETPPADTSAPEPEPSPNSEAARYRVERNELRAERDALAERLTGYQRRECEAVVANLLDVPADLWEVGQADVAAFYNDDGTLNEAEVQAAAGALVDQRPRLAKPQGPRYQNFGQYSAPPPPESAGWGAVIKSQ